VFEDKKTEKEKQSLYEEYKSFFYLIVILLSIRILIFEPFHIPSSSMVPTLIKGDYVFSTKFDYGFSRHSFIISTNFFNGRVLSSQPRRGDIIIFRPPHMMDERYIKRLIGLPGDRVQLKNGFLYINGKAIERQLLKTYEDSNLLYDEYREILPSGKTYKIRQINTKNLNPAIVYEINKINNTEVFIVPDDHYFFLGDNRDESGDSRYQLGFVPFENFISKARFTLYSFSEDLIAKDFISLDQIKQIFRWFNSFRFNRFFGKINE
jgi:signal peptidase I